MAKGDGKRSLKATRRNEDAVRMAAIRWLVMRIEQICIEVLVTDRDKFSDVEDALRAEVRLLQQIGRPVRPLDDEDCPGGYIRCRDGLCAPMCDDFENAAAPVTDKKGRKKR